jgi:hypothetical protein
MEEDRADFGRTADDAYSSRRSGFSVPLLSKTQAESVAYN